MAKTDVIKMDGEIIQELSNANFKVELDNEMQVTCTLSGKMRQKYIKVITGDRVQVEMSPYDLTRGRISYRYTTRSTDMDKLSTKSLKKNKK